ncbi:MAG: 50S ribosomal protein L11 methyltransferase [Chlamydiales bacterium]|nr:50S ribosomal protein L11 methyltransferase [Chlamydiales bacterium]
MKHYQFKIITNTFDAEKELSVRGLQHLYSIEELDCTLIGGFAHSLNLQNLKHSKLISQDDGSVDWQQEWQAHAPNFDGELMHIPNYDLRIKPGPGFGDLSHPTTQLMIEMMQKAFLKNSVIDLGCGSGVLGCVALKCNVKQLYMVDIDPLALDHSRLNVELNDLPQAVYSSDVKPEWQPDTILMNMIWQEQMQVMDAYPFLREFKGNWILSGILKEQQSDYMKWAGITPDHILEKDNWICVQGSTSCHPYRPFHP